MSDEADDKTRIVRRPPVPEPVEADDATRVVRRAPIPEPAVPEPVERVEGPDPDATRLVTRTDPDATVAITRHPAPEPVEGPNLPTGRTAFVPDRAATAPIESYAIRELPGLPDPVIRSAPTAMPPRARPAAKRRGSRLGTIALIVVPVLVIAAIVAVVAWLVLR